MTICNIPYLTIPLREKWSKWIVVVAITTTATTTTTATAIIATGGAVGRRWKFT